MGPRGLERRFDEALAVYSLRSTVLHTTEQYFSRYDINLNKDKSNVILYPTRYAGTHLEQGYLINDKYPINPKDFFIIIPNMFCNGVSSSPSNSPKNIQGPNFPLITILDNVRAQKTLLKKVKLKKDEVSKIRDSFPCRVRELLKIKSALSIMLNVLEKGLRI